MLRITQDDPILLGSSFTLRDRVTSLDGTGSPSAPGEFPPVKPGDIATVSCAVHQLDSVPPGLLVSSPSVTTAAFSSSIVLDQDWPDAYGRNFFFTLAPTAFPSAGRFRVTVPFTTTGGYAGAFAHDVPVLGS